MTSKRVEEMAMEEIKSNGGINSNTGSASSSRNHLESEKQPSSSSSNKGGSKDEEVPYYKLFSFIDSLDVMLMIVGTLGAIGNGVSFPVMTLLFGNIVNSFGDNPEDGEMLAAVVKVSLQFVYLAIGNGMASALQVICWTITGERQASRIRNLYLETILRQDIAFFDKDTNNSGEVVERISCDTFLIQDAMGEKVGKFLQFLATFFGGFVISFVKGWLLTLVMLSIIPPLVFSGALLAQVLTRMAIQGQNSYTDAANTVDQTISSIRTVASFTGEKKAIDKYNKSIKIAANASVRKGIATGLGVGSVMFVMFCGYSLGVWYGGKLILTNGYTGGQVITVILALISASFTLGQTSPCMTAFAAGKIAGYKMFETINRKPEIDSYDNSGKLDDIHGDIELRNVVFSYPTRPNEKIFSGFSLSINSGMSVALVGESGSGKSTVISLIERFYDPQSGQVLIDGINLKEFQLRWIRRKIGLVSQEPVLFLSSIRDNIAYGKNEATLEEIKAAAELANASKFIAKMPQGFETMVGENGTQLSGGQKQRIAIARAILKDPKILLLDEATSALDAESERIVQEALDRVITNRTTVIVAHRLSTVKNADMIAVIHRGSIVEKGSHSELCRDQNGAYSQLIRLQEMNKDSSTNDLDRTYSMRSHSSLKHRCLSQNSPTGNNSQQYSLTDESMAIPISSKYIESHEQTQKASFRRLANLNKPETSVLILGAFVAIIQGMVMPVFGLLLSQVIVAFYKPPDLLKKDTRFWALILIITGLVSLFIYPVKAYLFALAGSELVKRVRSMCFEKVVYMEVGWFDNSNNSSGAIGTRLSTDSESVKSVVGDSLAFVVINISSMIAGLVIAFTASWKLSLIVLALVPLIGLSEYIQMNFIKGFGEDAKTMYEDASQVANDAVRNIRTVASFSAEENVIELYKKKCEIPMKLGIRGGLVSGVGFGVAFFLIYCVYAVVFYVGAKLINNGTATFNDLFRVFFSLSMAATAISQSSSLGSDTAKAKSATRSIFRILDQKSAIESNDNSGMVLEQVRGSIKFQNVKFTYPTRPDVQIFRDISFTAHSGKVIGLVGESGCGKSTVISLLQRFYDPDCGQIFLDGINTKMLKLQWLRQQMGVVSQEPVLFNETIRANIAYGGKEDEAAESDIIASAEFANAHRFISGLEQGYDTIVGERGIQLSGGQKQRVAIARAILKEPKILLLDEATSALDAESERVVQDALERVMVNRTTIVVAHRLSTIKGADMIAVVKDGSIVEQGKHDSLINIKDGAYASLVALHSSY